MPFFLLGKTPDGDLRLLSGELHTSRSKATAELSRLTADASFEFWDDEVFVIDLDSGTPVLLVRPASATKSEPEPEPEEPEAEEVAEEPEAEEEVAEEPEPEEEAAEEPEEEPEPEEAPEPEAEEEVAEGPEAEEEAAEEEPADEPEEEAAEEAVTEEPEDEIGSVLDDLELEEEPAEEGTSLKDAIARTAASMEAEGIVAPESVGPAEAAEEEPAEEAESEPEAEEGEEAAEGEEPAAETSWPWDTQGTGSFKLDALEEPGPDEGSLIRAAGDDETMDVSRPVILGAYEDDTAAAEAEASIERIVEDLSQLDADEEPAAEVAEIEEVVEAEPEPVIEPEPEPVAIPDAITAPEPYVAPAVEPEFAAPAWVQGGGKPKFDDVKGITGAAKAPAMPKAEKEKAKAAQASGDAAPAGSDFIELNEVAAPQATGYSASGGELDGLTCNDCVYVDTCPNKDQREPASCGSFQWK